MASPETDTLRGQAFLVLFLSLVLSRNGFLQAVKVAQQVKRLPRRPGNLSYMAGTHVKMEGVNWTHKKFSDLCIHATQTKILNVGNEFLSSCFLFAKNYGTP